MKSTLLPFVTMMTLLFLLPTGCRKDDSVSQPELADEQLMRDFLSDDYFATASEYYNPSPADPSAQTTTESRTKKSMTTALKDYFAKNPKEVKKINQKYGYPVWEHALNADNEEGDFYHLPFAMTNKNKIEAILYAYKKSGNNKLGFLLIERKNLSKLMKSKKAKKNSSGKYEEMTVELAVTSTAYFENQIFLTYDCELIKLALDSNLKNGFLENRSCTYVITSTPTWGYLGYSNGTESIIWYNSYSIQAFCAYPTAYGPDGSTNAGTTGGTGSSTSTAEYETEGDDILRYYISDIAPEGICKNSINFVNTGSGRTACVEDRYRMVSTNGIVYWVNLSYCITIPGWMNVNTAQEIVANNLAAAKNNAHDLYRMGVQTSSGTVRGAIDEWFKDYSLADLPFSSVSSGRCQNISCNKVTYEDFWGNCN